MRMMEVFMNGSGYGYDLLSYRGVGEALRGITNPCREFVADLEANLFTPCNLSDIVIDGDRNEANQNEIDLDDFFTD